MTTSGMSEADWEALVLDTLGELAWQPRSGESIAPGTDERTSWDDLLIPSRLLTAMQQLNPTVPAQYLRQALAEIAAPKSQDAITENHRIHAYLVGGFRGITYIDAEGMDVTPTIPPRQRRTGRQRLARRQPGDRGPRRVPASLRRRALLQRTASQHHRAQESRQRAGRHLLRTRSAPDLSAGVPARLPVLRVHARLRRDHR
jgi:hypothetical protein